MTGLIPIGPGELYWSKVDRTSYTSDSDIFKGPKGLTSPPEKLLYIRGYVESEKVELNNWLKRLQFFTGSDSITPFRTTVAGMLGLSV